MSSHPNSKRRRIRRRLSRLHGEIERIASDLPDFPDAADLHHLASRDDAYQSIDPSLYVAPGVPRIRPVLVHLAARAAGAEESEATEEIVMAAEFLGLAVRVHDVALGRQDGRRRRAARRVLGGAVHWLGGNHLTLRALELSRHAPTPEILADLVGVLREIADANAMVDALQSPVGATPEDCFHLAEGVTGSVVSFCARSGGHLAEADRRVISALGRYGRNVGAALHVAEDIAILSSPRPESQRNLLLRNKPALPIAHALQRDHHLGIGLAQLRESGDPLLAAELTDRIEALGGLDAANEAVIRYAWTARRALGAVPENTHRESLDRLAQNLAQSA